MLYVVAIIVAVVLLRVLFRGKKTTKSKRSPKDAKLAHWQAAESQDVKRPRDPRTKFCLANLGQKITLTYHGRRRILTPLRVFTKPKFRKTYVLAEENGEQKTFDIDDMTNVVGMERPRPLPPRPADLVENADAVAKTFLAGITRKAKAPAKPDKGEAIRCNGTPPPLPSESEWKALLGQDKKPGFSRGK